MNLFAVWILFAFGILLTCYSYLQINLFFFVWSIWNLYQNHFFSIENWIKFYCLTKKKRVFLLYFFVKSYSYDITISMMMLMIMANIQRRRSKWIQYYVMYLLFSILLTPHFCLYIGIIIICFIIWKWNISVIYCLHSMRKLKTIENTF